MWIILPLLGFFVAFQIGYEKPFVYQPNNRPVDPKYLAKLARRREKRDRLAAYYAEREARYQSRVRLMDCLRLRAGRAVDH